MDDVGAMLRMWDNGIANSAGPRQIKLALMWYPLANRALGDTINYFTGNGTTAATISQGNLAAGN